MKLFLSSYRFGTHTDEFVRLTGSPGPIAVIANAADAWPASARAASVTSELGPLREMGYEPIEWDLRDFADRSVEMARALDATPAVWVRGGNTFVLRAQLARTGADRALGDRIRAGTIVYGGYSAGACVVAPTLAGVDDADDPDEVRRLLGVEPIRDGLGLVDFSIVPHVNSVLDEHDSAPGTLARLTAAGIACHGLTDEQAVIVDADGVRLLG